MYCFLCDVIFGPTFRFYHVLPLCYSTSILGLIEQLAICGGKLQTAHVRSGDERQQATRGMIPSQWIVGPGRWDDEQEIAGGRDDNEDVVVGGTMKRRSLAGGMTKSRSPAGGTTNRKSPAGWTMSRRSSRAGR